MPANFQKKQGARDELGRFPKGQSGNPAGRPVGSRNAATQLAEAMLDGEAAALTRIVLERAFEGDAAAMKLAFERIVPRRQRTVPFALPEIAGPADLAPAMAAIARAVAEGAIAVADAAELARMVETAVRAVKASDFDRRLREMEAAIAPRA